MFSAARCVRDLTLCLTMLSGASSAHAYCRTTTFDREVDTCVVPCETEGYPLARPEPTIEYLLSDRPFPGFSQQELQSVFDAAFAQWTSVSCEAGPVELEIVAGGQSSLGVREPNDHSDSNVLGFLSAEEWEQRDFVPRAFALTRIRYNDKTGELVGADIWFNGGIGRFAQCPAEGCDPRDDTVDLANVATHEAGHFLGLAHSKVRGATMGCSAGADEVHKRDLSPDDSAGICAIYPPGVAFRSEYLAGRWAARSDSGGCSALPGRAARGAPIWLALLALGWCARRLRVRRS